MSKLPRVSIFNCVSTAIKMLKFSTKSIFENAGYDNFDYIVITWLASGEVQDYLEELREAYPDRVRVVSYETNRDVGYVPNLRGMMNLGFETGYTLNSYVSLVNTDMYFGRDWLINLVKYAKPDEIVNSVHITPIRGKHVVTANLGIPEEETFNMAGFDKIYNEVFEDRLETENERGGWVNTNTCPYLIHRKFWEIAGPWELLLGKSWKGHATPDRRFFQRCKDAGALFTMSHSSIVYHHEAVERGRGRPPGAEGMRNE